MNKIEIKRFLEANATISTINIKVEDESLFSCYGLEPLKEGRERDKRLRIPDPTIGFPKYYSLLFKLTKFSKIGDKSFVEQFVVTQYFRFLKRIGSREKIS